MSKLLVPDELWTVVEPLLPAAKPRRFRYPGRKPIGNRVALSVILYIFKSGANVHDMTQLKPLIEAIPSVRGRLWRLEHLRPLPVPRKADSAVCYRPDLPHPSRWPAKSPSNGLRHTASRGATNRRPKQAVAYRRWRWSQRGRQRAHQPRDY